jgi:hypothetical protein
MSFQRKFIVVLHTTMDSRVLAPIILSVTLYFVLMVLDILFELGVFLSLLVVKILDSRF